MNELNIIYEDDAIIVCEKEAGIAVQTKKIGQKDMESMLRTYRMQKGEPSYIGVIHRLDQPVRGVMVFAKTKEAAADLSRQVSEKTADKYYYAVVDGVPKNETDTLEDYLLKDGKTNLSKVVEKNVKGAKRAELSYEVLEKSETQALLKIKLSTGRHHQIRVQMEHAGYPLSCDRKYNLKEYKKIEQADSNKQNTEVEKSLEVKKLIIDKKYESRNRDTKSANQLIKLCSYKIGFYHPVTRRKMEFEIENPFSLIEG